VNSIESSDESPQLLKVIAEFQEQQKEHDERERQQVTLKYILAQGTESEIYSDTVNKMLATGFCQKTFSEFTLALINNQYHLLCCISATESDKVSAAAVIEPFHEHYIVTRDESGAYHQEQDSTLVLVHDLYYSSTLSLLQLLQVIHTTYKDSQFNYIMFDMTPYVIPDPVDHTKMVLTSMGKRLVKVIPPYKEMQINDALYIGVTKEQLGDIVASDSDSIDAPEKTLFFNFWSPAGNKLRFGTVTKRHKLPRVYYIIPYFGNIYLQGEKGNIKRLVKKRFGMKESEFEKAWEKARAYNPKTDHRNHFVQVRLTGAGANTELSDSTCAWQAFCSIVKAMDGNEVALALMQGSGLKESFKDLRFTKPSTAAPNKKTLIQLMNNAGYTGRLLWKDIGIAEKLTNVLLCCDESLHFVLCLIQDDLGAAKHAIAVNFRSKVVYDGYNHEPMPLIQNSFDVACGIGRKCVGVNIVMEVTSLVRGKRKRKR
jgi:hypothetical protein